MNFSQYDGLVMHLTHIAAFQLTNSNRRHILGHA